MAARFFDQCRQTEPPSGIARQARQPIQLQVGSQYVALRARLRFDPRRAYLGRNAHPGSVATEPICRPLCRRRKVELVIPGVRRSTHECLEAGVPPEFIGTRCCCYGRYAQIADVAGHEIAQYQTIGARTHDFYFNVCRCEAKRIRMKSQDLAHTGIVAASAPSASSTQRAGRPRADGGRSGCLNTEKSY
jgi:hypothetical protein